MSEQKLESPAPAPPAMVLSPRWVAFGALALALPLGVLILSRPEKVRLPVLAELPAFALTDHTGHAFGKREMLGKVHVVNFIFTSCAEACPRLTQKIRAIQDKLSPFEQARTIGLVSVSVDPQTDTPQKLAEYAKTFGANDAVWRFVTGPQADVERTVVQGFKVAMAKVPAEPNSGQAAARALGASDDPKSAAAIHAAAFDIVHGEQLVLVDVQGRIRGYYTADEAGTEKLLRDARLLATGGA